MKRSTKMLLGISIALITAVGLQATIGDRFHQRMRGHYGGYGCGRPWRDYHKNAYKSHEHPQDSPNENLNNQ